MRAVECDKAHAADINSLADALNEIVLDFAVVHVTPPKKDIGIIEHLIRQSLIGIVKRREGDPSYRRSSRETRRSPHEVRSDKASRHSRRSSRVYTRSR